jgi:hypothetical protein
MRPGIMALIALVVLVVGPLMGIASLVVLPLVGIVATVALVIWFAQRRARHKPPMR